MSGEELIQPERFLSILLWCSTEEMRFESSKGLKAVPIRKNSKGIRCHTEKCVKKNSKRFNEALNIYLRAPEMYFEECLACENCRTILFRNVLLISNFS